MIYILSDGNRHAGLFSHLSIVLMGLSAVDNTDNKVFVAWDANGMCYKDPNYGRNVWYYYFKQPFEEISKEELLAPGNKTTVFVDGGTPFAQPRQTPEMIEEARYLCKKYIKVKDHILEKVDKFMEENGLNDEKYFGVHLRRTDHIKDCPYLPYEKYFAEADELFEKYDKAVIASDEANAIKLFKERYGDKVCSYDSIRINGREGVHYSTVGKANGYKMGEDALIESILLSKSDFLVKTVSGLSMFAVYSNEDLKWKDLDADIFEKIYGHIG